MPNQIAFYPQSSGGSGGGMTLISGATISGANATFSAIPQTFNNLRIVANFSTSGGGSNMIMQFNGDAGADYDYSLMFVSSGAAAVASATATTLGGLIGVSHSGGLTIDIPNYHGSALAVTSYTATSSGLGNFGSAGGGSWANTGVTSIVITDGSSSGTMSPNSAFYLYGY